MAMKSRLGDSNKNMVGLFYAKVHHVLSHAWIEFRHTFTSNAHRGIDYKFEEDCFFTVLFGKNIQCLKFLSVCIHPF